MPRIRFRTTIAFVVKPEERINMEIKEKLNLENPFKLSGKLWLAFSLTAITAGIITFLLLKPDFTAVRHLNSIQASEA